MSGSQLYKQKSKPTRCGIKVMYWIDNIDYRNAVSYEDPLLYAAKRQLKNNELGHTALLLTIPKDEETDKKIKNYMYHNENKIFSVQSKKYVDENDNYLEEVYEIYLSYGGSDGSFINNLTFDQDAYAAWSGSSFNGNEELKELFSLESRYSKTENKIRTLPPYVIKHFRNLTNRTEDLSDISLSIVLLEKDIASLKSLQKKIIKMKSSEMKELKDDNSALLMLKRFKLDNTDDFADFNQKLRKLTESKNEELKKLLNELGGKYYYRDNYISLTNPSVVIDFPLSTDASIGMDYEKILQIAKEISISGERYNRFLKNCSYLTALLLEAGAPEELKPYFRDKLLGTVSTPQTVINSAYKAQYAIYNGQTWYDKIRYSRLNPSVWLDNLTSYILKTFIAGSTRNQKIIASLIAVAAIPLFIIRSILTCILSPIYTINTSLAWMKVFNSAKLNNFSLPELGVSSSRTLKYSMNFLRVLINIIALTNIILAIPTAIIATPIMILSKAIKSLFKPTTDISMPKETQEHIQQEDQKIATGNKYELIKNHNPQAAIEELKIFLTDPDKKEIIPYFDTATMQLVTSYINSLPNKEEQNSISSLLEQVLQRLNQTTSKKLSIEQKQYMLSLHGLIRPVTLNLDPDTSLDLRVNNTAAQIKTNIGLNKSFDFKQIINMPTITEENKPQLTDYIDLLKKTLETKGIKLENIPTELQSPPNNPALKND